MNDETMSRYLPYLPAIYQSGQAEDVEFLNNLLRVFEKMLSGRVDEIESPWGIEQVLNRFPQYLHPYRTPALLLEWLAGWFALDLRKGDEWEGADKGDLTDSKTLQRIPLPANRITRNRNVIMKLAPRLHLRGTKAGLEKALEVYLGSEAEKIVVNELVEPFQVGIKPSAIVGTGTVVGEAMPYYFRVHMKLPAPKKPVLVRKRKLVIAEIINQEKPAHTYYTLKIKVPPMQVGRYCTIGEDSLLGGIAI